MGNRGGLKMNELNPIWEDYDMIHYEHIVDGLN